MSDGSKQFEVGRPQMAAILGFTFLYLMAAGILSLVRGNREFVFYIIVMAVIIFGVMSLHKRVGLSAVLLGSLSFWGLLHMAGGLVPIPEGWHSPDVSGVLYNLWLIPDRLKYDQLVHGYGFAITTWACWQALRARLCEAEDDPRATFGMMVLCAAGGMGFGAFNEVIEFFATLILRETNVGGYVNTGWDLVANLVGAISAAVIIYYGKKWRKGEA